ncbi:MAG: hypothetical protein QW607_07590 [Desulfurococcaceae archaeon]
MKDIIKVLLERESEVVWLDWRDIVRLCESRLCESDFEKPSFDSLKVELTTLTDRLSDELKSIRKSRVFPLFALPGQFLKIWVDGPESREEIRREKRFRENLRRFAFLLGGDDGRVQRWTMWKWGEIDWWMWYGWAFVSGGSNLVMKFSSLTEYEMVLQWAGRMSVYVSGKMKLLKSLLEDEEVFDLFIQCFELEDLRPLYRTDKEQAISEAIERFRDVIRKIQNSYSYKRVHPYVVKENQPLYDRELKFKNPLRIVLCDKGIGVVLEPKWTKGVFKWTKRGLKRPINVDLEEKLELSEDLLCLVGGEIIDELSRLRSFLSMLRRDWLFTHPVIISRDAFYQIESEKLNFKKLFLKLLLILCFWRGCCFAPQAIAEQFARFFDPELCKVLEKLYPSYNPLDLVKFLIEQPILPFLSHLRVDYSKEKGLFICKLFQFDQQIPKPKQKSNSYKDALEYLKKEVKKTNNTIAKRAKLLPFYSLVEKELKNLSDDFWKKYQDLQRKKSKRELQFTLREFWLAKQIIETEGEQEVKYNKFHAFSLYCLFHLYKDKFYEYCQKIGIKRHYSCEKLGKIAKRKYGKGIRKLELEELIEAMIEFFKSPGRKRWDPSEVPASK